MLLVQEVLRGSLESREHLYVSSSNMCTDRLLFLPFSIRENLELTVRREDQERLENRGLLEFLDHRGPREHKEKV